MLLEQGDASLKYIQRSQNGMELGFLQHSSFLDFLHILISPVLIRNHLALNLDCHSV